MPDQILDYSLNAFKVPGLALYSPPFGEIKEEGEGLSTMEITRNEMMPFLKQRPISGVPVTAENDLPIGIIDVDSIATPIEFDANFAVAEDVSLQLDDPSYEGQIVRVVASFETGNPAYITLGLLNEPETLLLQGGGIALLFAVNGKWILFKSAEDVDVGSLPGRVEDVETQLTQRAPTNHASPDPDYGKGDNANYGHVKLNSATLPVASNDSMGAVGVSGKAADALHKHPSDITRAPINSPYFEGVPKITTYDTISIPGGANSCGGIDPPTTQTVPVHHVVAIAANIATGGDTALPPGSFILAKTNVGSHVTAVSPNTNRQVYPVSNENPSSSYSLSPNYVAGNCLPGTWRSCGQVSENYVFLSGQDGGSSATYNLIILCRRVA